MEHAGPAGAFAGSATWAATGLGWASDHMNVEVADPVSQRRVENDVVYCR
jgi:hypothetical protein